MSSGLYNATLIDSIPNNVDIKYIIMLV